ncbi:MAG: hypothetical protein EBZ50_08450, partial [Alphaproteobacteria bacterium]|nr:hypothetical protein [Alphaproteobacteria bacterium]
MIENSGIFLLLACAAAGAALWAWARATKFEAELAAATARLENLTAVQHERDAALAAREAAQAEASRLGAALSAAESAATVRAQALEDREKAMLDMRAEFERNFAELASQALARNEQRFITLA